MKRTLQDHYGVDLNNYANRAITEAWDSAQSEVGHDLGQRSDGVR